MTMQIDDRKPLTVFPDANALFSRSVVLTLLEQPIVKLLPEIAAEIRARNEDVVRNCRTATLEAHAESSSIVRIQTTRLFDLVLILTSYPSPLLRTAVDEALSSGEFDLAEYNKVLQDASRNASCFDFDDLRERFASSESPHVKKMMRASIKSHRRQSSRSLFKYAKAYLSKNGPSTDEIFAATAITYALLHEVPTAIISDDADLRWLMKQFTDNLILEHLLSSKLVLSGKIELGDEEFRNACQNVDRFRLKSQERDYPMLKRLVTPEMSLPSTLRICSHISDSRAVLLVSTTGESWGQYSFPLALLEFLRIKSRELGTTDRYSFASNR